MPHRSSTRFARLLLVFALVFAALVPAALFAQSADVVGVWQSDVIDAGMEGSDGLIVTISLFDDGTHETTSDSQDGEAPIFEQGDWVDNEDGAITISFITSDGEYYGEPVDVVFEVGEDTLTAPELGDYGPDGLVVIWTGDEPVSQAEDLGFEPTADVVATARGDEEMSEEEGGEEEATDEDVFDIEGVYISDELVDETGTGAVMIYMTEDGLVQSLFANFDGESAPVGRLGTWEETEDGLIAVSLDQELVVTEDSAEAADLDEPEAVEFELVNGVLVNELFTLYPVDEITEFWSFEEDDSGASEDEAAGEEESADVEFLTFATSEDEMAAGNTIIVNADSEGYVSVAIERVDAEISAVYEGFWEETEDGILFTLDTDAEGNEVDPPIEVLFEEGDDGSLIGVDFDTDLFGEELVLLPIEE